jgi:hypothetical protein
MPPSDNELVLTLVHDANRYLSADRADSVRRESDLEHVKEVLGLAEKLLVGEATDEDRALVGDLVQQRLRTLPDS